MTSKYEMRFPFSTTKEINDWADRYIEDRTGAQKLVEQYLMGLKDTVSARETPKAPAAICFMTNSTISSVGN